MEKGVLEFLETNELLHMGMIFPIKRGTVDIIHANSDGVFLKELNSGAYMLSYHTFDKGKELLDSVGEQALFCVHQEMFADYLFNKYNFEKKMTCFQAVYKLKKRVKNGSRLDIRQLDIGHVDMIYSHYHSNAHYQYIKRRLECGEIYGGFTNSELCGFVGTHEEGSIGILKVFPQFRKQGFGAELEGYLINNILDKNQIPFSQIEVDNEASIKLHEKLGFEISKDVIHWLF